MNRSESKYFNTALLMDEALISLLAVKDLEYITVKEICEKAGVNRSTFYLHYETVGDLLNEAMENIYKKFLSVFEANASELIGSLGQKKLKDLIFITSDYLYPYLNFVKENKKIFRAAFRNPDSVQSDIRLGELKRYVLEPILSRFRIPAEEQHYWISYYIHGTMAIIREWLLEDCRDSVEKIADIIEKCIRPLGGFEKAYEG